MDEDAKGSDQLKDQFLNVLEKKQIRTVFQPIVSLRNGSVYGYEALSRGPQDSPMHSPGVLFDCAEKYGKVWELELLCRITAIETLSAMNRSIKLFLNVNPQVIHDEKFKIDFTKEYLSYYNLNPQDLIFEITERGSVNNINDFIKTIDYYKAQNYKIAIDDAGAGYSGLNLISDIRPHFLKLDMNLIRDIDKDILKQALMKSLTEFASLTNTLLVAEGIETPSELAKLIEIGVNYGQGYYLQRPCASIIPLREEVVFEIREANRKKNHLTDRKASDLFISNISQAQKTLNPKILIGQVYGLMEEDNSISGFCVMEDGYPVGSITRAGLYRRLSGRPEYNLYAKEPVDKIMSRDFLQVDYHESIRTVSQKAMGRDADHLYDFITITRDGRYFGIVTVRHLLENAIQVEANNARHINPLSELPGNLIIEKKLEECLNDEAAYKILYFDMNNFKAYNDIYGFENGDRIIRHLAEILKKRIGKTGDFIGHIGGDDFVAIVAGNGVEELCRTVIDDFDRSVPDFYGKNDLDRGFITTKNRHGIEEDFPLLSIAIAVTSSKKCNTVYMLSKHMAELRRTCKQKPGSHSITDL